MAKQKKYCEWCSVETSNKPTLMPKIPILDELEHKIDKLGREEILDYYQEDNLIETDPTTRSEIYAYLDLLNDIKYRIICDNCLHLDEENNKKYYSYLNMDEEFWGGLEDDVD